MTGLITPEEYAADVARQMKEAALQSQILALASDLRWRAYHTFDSRRSHPGFPDLVLVSVHYSRVLWRELKTERGRVSNAQQAWLEDLRAAGQDAGIWRPSDLMSGRVLAELTTKEVA